MRYRPIILSTACATLLCAGSLSAAEADDAAPTTRPLASQPAASQPLSPDLARVRELLPDLRHRDAVVAADAVVEIKEMLQRGVPVWEALQPSDPAPAVRLLRWFQAHPGQIHYPSPLRLHWEAMDLFVRAPDTGQVRLMTNSDLQEYAHLARELLRDGDPYGYWALLDVALTATDLLGRQSDFVTLPLVLPFLDRHLDMHVIVEGYKKWKGYWAEPLTEPRPFPHPTFVNWASQPSNPQSPWKLPTVLLLQGLERYRQNLKDRGLWLSPPWEEEFTRQTATARLIEALGEEDFPARQHIYRLLRDRMADPEVREQVTAAVNRGHPHGLVLERLLTVTQTMVYTESLRSAWPEELAKLCPHTLDDLISGVPRRETEGMHALVATLLSWPDREWANRTAVKLFEATGKGEGEASTQILTTVDTETGVKVLLETYRREDLPPATYNTLHFWVRKASEPFRKECQDRDLAPILLKVTTASEPSIDTQREGWSRDLNYAYELVWWQLNGDRLAWVEEKHRLEVPADQLNPPTEEQIIEAYQERIRNLPQAQTPSPRQPRAAASQPAG